MKNLLLSFTASSLLLLTPAFSTTAGAAETAGVPTVQALTDRWASDHIEGRFVEKKTIAGFPKPLISSGRFTIDRQTGVIWETQKPFPNTLHFDDKGVRYAGVNAASSVSAGDVPAVGHLADMIRGILAGDLEMLSQLFTLTVTLEPEPTVRAQPKGKTMASAIAEIVISGHESIETIRLVGAAGDITDLTLTDQIRR